MRSVVHFFVEHRRFLRQLQGLSSLSQESQHVEAVLAAARLFLAVTSFLLVSLDLAPPARYSRAVVHLLLLGYVATSAAVWVIVRRRRASVPRTFGPAVLAADLAWAGLFTTLAEDPNSGFFIFFIFAELSAAYRWGLAETLATAAAAVGILTFEAFAFRVQELDVLSLRSTYVAIVAVLVGYLAEEEKESRAELAAITRVMSLVQANLGVKVIFGRAFDEMLRISGAGSLLLALEETDTRRLFLWTAKKGLTNGANVRVQELSDDDRATYFFPAPQAAWQTIRCSDERERTHCDVAVLGGGRRSITDRVAFPQMLGDRYIVGSTMAMNVSFGDAWTGRLLLLDVRTRTIRKLRFLQKIVEHLVPAMHSVYVLHRLRTRLGGLERTRLAQDLHDGIVQSLIGLQMNIDVLRREPSRNREELIDELGKIQQLLAQEIAAARELMVQVKPVDIRPQDFPAFVADLLDRFQRETGIFARFVSDVEDIDLPARTCRELARIVQEAVANVRKHSHARHVIVRLESSGDRWMMSIDNDGQPFDFTGRWSLAELDLARKGPVLIKQRVRVIGADLSISSGPGSGVRLEITVPKAQIFPRGQIA